MSDFKEMLFSETIQPLNWQELQARDEELTSRQMFQRMLIEEQQLRDEAMQKEIDDQLKEEMEEVKREQIKQDNQQLEQDDDYQDSGMSRSDFYSGGTF